MEYTAVIANWSETNSVTPFDFGCTTDCPKPMPLYQKALIALAYGLVVVLAVCGNTCVCYIVYKYKRMRTTTNYFIVNLALTDVLMAVLCIPFTFISNLLVGYWPFGIALCPMVTYSQGVAVFLSAFTLVVISLDRFAAVVFPLRPKLRKGQKRVILSVVWILSLGVSAPLAINSRVVEQPDVLSGHMRPFCEERWTNKTLGKTYSLFVMILQYFVPLFVMGVTYAWIGVVIWVKRIPPGVQTSADMAARITRSKRKVVKMMITVVAIYGVCWLPFHTITLLGEYRPNIYTFRYIQPVWILCHWIAMSNSCCNPIVYCWMNACFRTAFARIFACCPCITANQDILNRDLLVRKARGNYSCVYTMNLNNKNQAKFVQNGVRRCVIPLRQPNSSSSGKKRGINDRSGSVSDPTNSNRRRFNGDVVEISLHRFGRNTNE